MSQSQVPAGTRAQAQAQGCVSQALRVEPATPVTDTQFAGRIISIVYSKGQSIFEAGDAADTIYLVVSGAVIVHRTDVAGRREVIEFAGEGALLGMVSGPNYGCSATSLIRIAVAAIRQDAIAGSLQLQQRIGRELTLQIGVDARAGASTSSGFRNGTCRPADTDVAACQQGQANGARIHHAN